MLTFATTISSPTISVVPSVVSFRPILMDISLIAFVDPFRTRAEKTCLSSLSYFGLKEIFEISKSSGLMATAFDRST